MKISYRIVYTACRFFFKCFFRLKVHGQPRFRPGAAVLAANHVSFFDPPVISVSCPEEVHFLARSSLFEIPLFGSLIRMLNSHPVARGASDASTFRFMVQLLREEKKLVLFPEGKRSYDGEIQPLERGLAFLIQKAHCRVMPVYLHGMKEAWPRGKKWPSFFRRIDCVFGKPIEWSEFGAMEKKKAQEALTERVETALCNLKKWCEEGMEGEPP